MQRLDALSLYHSRNNMYDICLSIHIYIYISIYSVKKEKGRVSKLLCLQCIFYYLSIECLESLFNLLSLSVGPFCQHVDDGLLVRTESFHGCSECGGVGFGIEIGCRADCGSALYEKHNKHD